MIAALMMAHALLGCCWHHAHASQMVCDDHVAAVHADVHGHCHEEHAAKHEHSDTPAPCNQGDACDEEGCIFVRTDSGPIIHSLSHKGFVTLATSDCLFAIPKACKFCSAFSSRQPTDALPLRAHLMLQILLI
jgi:hypothetical protein